jgi:hypothetical protein
MAVTAVDVNHSMRFLLAKAVRISCSQTPDEECRAFLKQRWRPPPAKLLSSDTRRMFSSCDIKTVCLQIPRPVSHTAGVPDCGGASSGRGPAVCGRHRRDCTVQRAGRVYSTIQADYGVFQPLIKTGYLTVSSNRRRDSKGGSSNSF